MDNSSEKYDSGILIFGMQKKLRVMVAQDKYKCGLFACLCAGIIFGCVTQAVYGGKSEWYGAVEKYCVGFLPAFLSVVPVTLGFTAVFFALAPFQYLRLLIFPASVFRGMGLGALLCGAVQFGCLREVCFAALTLLPYAASSCVLNVFAGEYCLGLKGAFTTENKGLTGILLLHTIKMMLLYLLSAAGICAVFGASCVLFGIYLI